MAKKKFDPTNPHYHQCPTCLKEVYCAGPNCEIPQRTECPECAAGFHLINVEGEPGYYRPRPRRFDDDTEVRVTG